MARVAVKVLLLLVNLVVSGLGLWGTFELARRGLRQADSVLLLPVPVVVIALVHFFLFAAQRYQVPILPFLLVFGTSRLQALEWEAPWSRMEVAA